MQQQNWWLPQKHCPWGQHEKQQNFHDFKCDRGDFNLYNFRSRIKKDFYRELDINDNDTTLSIEPVVVRSKYSNSLYCVIDKCGSTAWKRVINKAMGAGKDQVLSDGLYIHYLPLTRIGDLNNKETINLLDSPKVTRWMIERNPYARIFSSYYDKLVKGRLWEVQYYQNFFGFNLNEDQYPTFEQFINKLYQIYNGTYNKSLSAFNGIDRPFDLQVSRCGMQQGMGWDYVLKLEQISEWYPKIIDVLNFTEVVMSGWPDDNKCFLSTPDLKCDGPNLGGNKDADKAKQLHTLRSRDYMLKSYNKQIAAQVTEMYMPDLIGLKYPLWDGNSNTFKHI